MSGATTILLVEDNDGDALILEELFDDGHVDGPVELIRATSIADALRALTEGADPVCALVDLGLPDAIGTDAVEALSAAAPELPIVVLTGSDDPELARDALRAGAQDYLVKGTELDEEVTRRAVRYAVDRASTLRALHASRRELRDFAHRVAHDLKSPMSVVLGSLDLLQHSRPDDENAELYDMLGRSSRRLVEMVDRLLEYADTAGSDEMLGPVRLDDVLAWVTEALESALDGVTLQVDEPLPVVHGNEVGLRHVLLNLITNAIKFSAPERPPAITIHAAETAERDTVVVAVADNGRGIPPDMRLSVFGAGFRVEDSEPGTGLGLATVQRTMQLVGGRVRIEDGPNGVGTTFLLEFRPPADTGA